MSISKNLIVKKMTIESSLTSDDNSILLESFLSFIKKNAKSHNIKLSGFGVFSFKKTLKRSGRNPKTLDSYIIPSMNKLNFRPSNKLKRKIN
jgi:nucleoid DNA-binding protein